MLMRKDSEFDRALRARLRAWVLYLMEQYRHAYPTQVEFARAVGVAPPTVNMAINRPERGIGLDFVTKLHRAFHVSIDVLVDSDPPTRDKGRAPDPRSASPARAEPGRRGEAGG